MTPGAQRPGDPAACLPGEPARRRSVPRWTRHRGPARRRASHCPPGPGSSALRRPVSMAIAAAGSGWSPVTIATLIPAAATGADHLAGQSAHGGSSRASGCVGRDRARRTQPRPAHRHRRRGRRPPGSQTPLGERLQRTLRRLGVTAQVERCIRSALDEHLPVSNDRHPSPSRIEWEAGGVDSAAALGIRVDPESASKDVDCCFHRITVRAPRAVDSADKARRASHRSDCQADDRLVRSVFDHHLAAGVVAGLGGNRHAVGRPCFDNGHLVAGQRPRSYQCTRTSSNRASRLRRGGGQARFVWPSARHPRPATGSRSATRLRARGRRSHRWRRRIRPRREDR